MVMHADIGPSVMQCSSWQCSGQRSKVEVMIWMGSVSEFKEGSGEDTRYP